VSTHEPKHYDLPRHAAAIFRMPAFIETAKNADPRPEDFQNNVVAELKRIVAEQRAQELADYEQVLGVRALTAAVEKLKADKAA
jgi:hypothetical protein